MTPGELPCDAAAGFTLLEVLVALTILGLSLAAIFAIFSQSLSREHARDDAYRAQILAQSLIADSAAAPTVQAGEHSGETADGFTWKIDVAPYEINDDWTAPGLHAARVSVAVTWAGTSRPQSLNLATLRLAPREQTP